MKLECGDEIEDQYLPFNGGQRKITCHHGIEYLITAERRTTTEFTVKRITGEEEDGED